MARIDRLPEGKDLTVPVSVPSESGNSELVVGKGSLKGGQLVVRFNDKVHSRAVQRLLSRGAILGIQFVMFAPDDANVEAQRRLDAEAETQDELETIPEEKTDD
jgi:hypothetical protein